MAWEVEEEEEEVEERKIGMERTQSSPCVQARSGDRDVATSQFKHSKLVSLSLSCRISDNDIAYV